MGVQVQTATKYNDGGTLKSLPIIQRQFISFSYGGRDIEDFDLLAVFSGDRLNKEIYAPFKDIITEQEELDGQFFWGTSFNACQLNFILATDGITGQQLEDFKKWFQPGIEKELILSEYHNRAIMARVSNPPQISLLPFEKEVKVKIGNEYFSTKTSLYKGEINLSFVMDNPFWYAKDSYLSGELNQENIKIIYEDGIPHLNMFNLSECLLANNYCYLNKQISKNEGGIILDNVSDINQTNNYLYYCGTAISKPEISFSILPSFNDIGEIFFPTNANESSYWLKIGNKKFVFSLPDIMITYNKALKIVHDFEGTSILDLRKLLRDSLYNYYARAWAINLIDKMMNDPDRKYVSESGEIKNNFKENFKNEMQKIFSQEKYFKFDFNSKNGSAQVSYNINNKNEPIIENAGNIIKSEYLIIEPKILLKDGIITQDKCLELKTSLKLEKVFINYKYMYL